MKTKKLDYLQSRVVHIPFIWCLAPSFRWWSRIEIFHICTIRTNERHKQQIHFLVLAFCPTWQGIAFFYIHEIRFKKQIEYSMWANTHTRARARVHLLKALARLSLKTVCVPIRRTSNENEWNYHSLSGLAMLINVMPLPPLNAIRYRIPDTNTRWLSGRLVGTEPPNGVWLMHTSSSRQIARPSIWPPTVDRIACRRFPNWTAKYHSGRAMQLNFGTVWSKTTD